MADRGPRATVWLWAPIIALLAGALAFLGHAALAYYTVTGWSFDWLDWKPHRTLSANEAALEIGLSVFLATAILAAVAGAFAWWLAGRGWLRSSARKVGSSRPTTWSELSNRSALGLAALFAMAAALSAFLLAVRADPDAVSGQDFWVLQAAVGTTAAVLACFLVVATIARAHAQGRLLNAHPKGNLIARTQLVAAKNARSVVMIVVLLTIVAAIGVTKITTDVDVADVLPRGDGNTSAAKNLTAHFKSTFTQQVTVQFRYNPSACAADSGTLLPDRQTVVTCDNITDEVYVRALDEFFKLVKAEGEENPIEYNIGVPAFYRLINWTIAGGQGAPDDSFGLPDVTPEGEYRYRLVHEGVWTAIPDVVTPLLDPEGKQTAMLFLVSTGEEASSQEIGHAMLAFRDKYVNLVADGETRYTVFGPDNPPLFTVDLPIANAHSSDLAREDFLTLFPIIFAFIAVTLYFSFRNLAAIGIAGAMLLVASVWTFGLMGFMGIPLNSLNLTLLPLILGVGIDYSIHQITEFANHKRDGLSDEEALRIAGGFSGFALFIGTATSVSGLLVMTASPSLLMAQLGFLGAVAMVSVYTLAITFVPALLKLARSSDRMGKTFEPSGFMLGLARAVSRGRIAVAMLVILISVGTAITATLLTIEPFGEPAKNFPADDPLRIEHEEGIRGFYDLRNDCDEDEAGVDPACTEYKTNIIVFEGDNTDYQSHRWMEQVQSAMRDEDPTLNLRTSRTLPFLIRTWLTVKDGVPGAGIETLRDELAGSPLGDPLSPVLEPVDPYPRTRRDIQRTLDEVFDSPLATFGSLFADAPEYNITVMTFATKTGDFEEAERGWDAVWRSIDAQEASKPHDLTPAFVGNTALNYLFVTKQLPWLGYLGIVAAIAAALLVTFSTKSLRAVLAVSAVMFLTTSWWLGVLPFLDIGLAITLMLPAIFIISIGSDFAVHMAWSLLRNPDRAEVYGVVGKAILYSMITTVGAFAIFTQTQNVAAAKATVATVVAFILIFMVTILVMPLFYPVRGEDEPEVEEEETPALDHAPRTRIVEKKRPVEASSEVV